MDMLNTIPEGGSDSPCWSWAIQQEPTLSVEIYQLLYINSI
jgi:hypothetical protein